MRVLFTGPAGIDFEGALSKLAKEINRSDPPKILKFEDFLIEAHELKLNDLGVVTDKESEKRLIKGEGGLQHLLKYPKSHLRRIWAEAINLLKKKASEYEHIFFSMHTIYYQTQYREYFFALEEEKIRELSPGLIITLIDDIYDVHARLRRSLHVFDDDYLRKACPNAKKRVCARISQLLRILQWRSKEIITAEKLAICLGLGHHVLAVKHPLDVAKHLISENANPIYLSHPISEVRRLLDKNELKKAKAIQNEIDELAKSLIREKRIALILPTTIDEKIIALEHDDGADDEKPKDKKKKEKKESEKLFWPLLNERWPLPGRENELLYCPPEKKPANPLDVEGVFFDERGHLKVGKKNKYLFSAGIFITVDLLEMIGDQINSRDRQLVDQSSAICVYRPYFNGNHSTGVSEEINHRTTRFRMGIDESPKPCVIFCPPEDLALVRVKQLLKKIEEGVDKKFTEEEKISLTDRLQRDSEVWNKLCNLDFKSWTGQEVQKLCKDAGIIVTLPLKAEGGTLKAHGATRYSREVQDAWDDFASELNTHPLAEILVEKFDQWIDDEDLTPRQFADIVWEKIKGLPGR